MNANSGLTPRQNRTVEVLARGVTFEEAAREGGVSTRALFEWRRTEPFQAAIREAQHQLFRAARGELRAATAQAVRTLREIVIDVDAPASARVRAALGILDHVHRHQEMQELEERLAQLEDAVGERVNGRRSWRA